MKFVRFGGLSPVKQDQYKTKDKTFHNPPKKKGIYAFPWPYIEYFLLSSTSDPGHVSNKSKWVLDTDGNKIPADDAYVLDDVSGWVEWDKFENPVFKPEFKKLFKRLGVETGSLMQKDYKGVNYFIIRKKPRTFQYDGQIWHHLGERVKPGFVLATSGSWILTDMDIYEEALRKEKHAEMKHLHSMKCRTMSGNVDPFKGRGSVSRDHLEVFIESI